MDLRDQMASDAAALFLDTSGFAEVVTLYPADGGEPRPVTAIVTCRRSRESRRQSTSELEVATVQLLKDESHVKGGLTLPTARGHLADCIVRQGETLANKLAFSGRILGEPWGGAGWRLEFHRHSPIRTGGMPY